MSRYHAISAAADIGQETLASLILKLESAVIRKLKGIPNTAPIALQLISSLSSIKAELEPVVDLAGRDAVKAFLHATSKHFLSDFPPLKALARKYPEISVDHISGEMWLD